VTKSTGEEKTYLKNSDRTKKGGRRHLMRRPADLRKKCRRGEKKERSERRVGENRRKIATKAATH